MKYTGGALVWLALSVLGMFAAERLARRVRMLENVLLLLKKTELEVRQFSRPFSEIVERLSREEGAQETTMQCARNLKSGVGFPEAWKTAVENSRLPFKKGERKKLSKLGKELSSCDREGCFQVLSVYSQELSLSLEEAKKEKAKYSKLCLFSGVFVGALIFISIA